MKIKTMILMIVFVFFNYLLSAQGLRVEPKTNIKIETGTILDISAGNLILESDPTGDASLIDLGAVTYSGSGQANVQRYLTNGKWHLISSPITNALSGMFTADYLQYHTESTNLYTDIIPTTYTLLPMKGYSLWSMEENSSTEVFEGITNTGEQTFSFTKESYGFNLMGNPYPSAIDWDLVSIPTNLNGYFYLWDPTTGENGDYVYYIKNGGTANSTSQYIPSGQGFFTSAIGLGTLTLNNSVRTLAVSQLFYKNQEAQTMLVLKISGNNITTQTAIRFIAEATPQIDRLFDVPKIISGYPDVPNLYSFSENQEMAINTLPSIAGYEIIPLSFKVGTPGTYTIFATELESIPAEVPVFLEDVELKYFQDLRTNPEYAFISDATEAKDFKIYFKDVTGIDSPEPAGKLAVNCFLINHVLHVNFLNNSANTEKAIISVYSVTGQEMLHLQTFQPDNEIPFRGSQSIYIVNVTTNDGNFSTKVFNR